MVSQAPLVPLETPGSRDRRASADRLESLAARVQKAGLETLASRVAPVLWVPKAVLVFAVPRVKSALVEFLALRVLEVLTVPKVLKVLSVREATKVHPEPSAFKVLKARKVLLVQ